MSYEVFPEPVTTDEQTGAPVYGLTRDCPRILPRPSAAPRIVFALEVPEESSEESFWFVTNVLGQTLQSAADNGLKYYLIDRPNPLARKQIEPADLVDKYKPFGKLFRPGSGAGSVVRPARADDQSRPGAGRRDSRVRRRAA